MRVLVTGATGVYGRSVVERLHRAGHEVVAMARRPPVALPAGVRFAAADVRDGPAVEAAMAGCDVVVHLAFVVTPMKDREESRAISVGGTRNVVEAMQRTGARRLVFASSAMTYGANPDNPPLFTEEHQQRPSPDYVYGTDKVAARSEIDGNRRRVADGNRSGVSSGTLLRTVFVDRLEVGFDRQHERFVAREEGPVLGVDLPLTHGPGVGPRFGQFQVRSVRRLRRFRLFLRRLRGKDGRCCDGRDDDGAELCGRLHGRTSRRSVYTAVIVP